MSVATELAGVMDGMQFNDDYMHLDETDKQQLRDHIAEHIAALLEHREVKDDGSGFCTRCTPIWEG